MSTSKRFFASNISTVFIPYGNQQIDDFHQACKEQLQKCQDKFNNTMGVVGLALYMN